MTPENLRKLWLLRTDLNGHESLIDAVVRPAYPETANVIIALLKTLDEIEYPKQEPSAIVSPIQRDQL